MLPKGHKGLFHRADGETRRARVVRMRGGNRVDLAVDGIPPHDTQMVPLGAVPHSFLPDHYELVPAGDEPPPLRLVPVAPPPVVWPQYVALALSAAATTLALFELLHR